MSNELNGLPQTSQPPSEYNPSLDATNSLTDSTQDPMNLSSV